MLEAHCRPDLKSVTCKRRLCDCTQDLNNFRKELRLMAAVQHANVMPLLAAHVLPPGQSWATGVTYSALHVMSATAQSVDT